MLRTLAITGPIYLLIALGWLAVRGRAFAPPEMRVLGGYVIRFALPALLFNALSRRPIGAILNGRYLLDYAAGSLAVWALAFAWARCRQGKGLAQSALCGLGMSSSNSGYVGYPIALQAVGASTASVALALCMLVENLVMIPLTLAVADSGEASGRWQRVLLESARQLARNPIVLAIVAGVAVALIGVPLPAPLARTIDLLASSSTAVSLFVIGGSLVGLQLTGMWRDVSVIALGKLLLHPLAVGGMVLLVPPADPQLGTAALLFAATSMLGIYPILAQKYRLERFCAAALLLGTSLSFVTISLLLLLLGPMHGV